VQAKSIVVRRKNKLREIIHACAAQRHSVDDLPQHETTNRSDGDDTPSDFGMSEVPIRASHLAMEPHSILSRQGVLCYVPSVVSCHLQRGTFVLWFGHARRFAVKGRKLLCICPVKWTDTQPKYLRMVGTLWDSHAACAVQRRRLVLETGIL
jgi:hypothetical protein